jgi:hypothetical protein
MIQIVRILWNEQLGFLTKAEIRLFWVLFCKQREKSKRVKITFQIFNCKSIYNDYTYNYSYRKVHFYCLLSLF